MSGTDGPFPSLPRGLFVARVIAGHTQKKVAEVAEISTATICQLESGTANPSLLTLSKLCAIYGVSVDQIIRLGQADVTPASVAEALAKKGQTP